MGLLEFQQLSTNHIIEYFTDHSVYLLADETGLGKTHIASAVMQELAAKKNGKTDFRVVYIASDLTLAKNNAETKLKVEGSTIENCDRLSMVWSVLDNNNSTDNGIRIFPLTPEVSLKQKSSGKSKERNECEKKYISLQNQNKQSNQQMVSLSANITQLHNHLFKNFRNCTEPSKSNKEYDLYKEASKTQRGVAFWKEKEGIRYKNIELDTEPDKGFEELVNILVDMYINIKVRNEKKDPQSLCDAINKKSPIELAVSDVKEAKRTPWESVEEILKKLWDNIDFDDLLNTIKKDNTLTTNIEAIRDYLYYQQYIRYIRTFMSYYSLELLNPDLVIIDEIQNYPEIFEVNATDMDERSAVIKLVIDTILGKNQNNGSNTKVLMLSATPYAYRNAIEPEEDTDEEDELGNFTKHLVGLDTILNYMSKKNGVNNCTSDDIVGLWKCCQSEMAELANSELFDDGKYNCLKQLTDLLSDLSEKMKSIGISRTERPIHSYKPDDGKLTIKVDSISPSELKAFFKKETNNKHDAVNTRLALSLPRDIDPDCIKSSYKSLNDCKNNCKSQIRSSRIEALTEDMFEGNSYLWLFVPPNKPSRYLGCVFSDWLPNDEKKSRYWGKTLLFSAYSVVPKIISDCIEKKLNSKLKEYYDKNHSSDGDYDSLRINIHSSVNSECAFQFLKLTNEDKDLLKKYFSSDHAKRVILAVCGEEAVGNYWDCVNEYCKNGCFGDVLEEFKFMRDNTKNKPTLSDYLNECTDSMNNYCVSYNGTVGNGNTLESCLQAFNSPFYPFAFLLTSVAEEGHDFHWYADRIVHWNAPSTPIALLQREGRVDRINCMAVRKTIAKKTDRSEPCFCWNNMIDTYKNTYKYNCKNYQGMFPNFWAGKDAEKIHRYCYYYPYSSDHFRWKILIKNLEYYRSMFGAYNGNIDESKLLNDDNWEELKKLRIDISIKKPRKLSTSLLV